MLRVGRRGLLTGAGVLTLLLLAPIAWVQGTGHSRVRASVEAVGPVDAVVVLGAGLRPDGTPSTYLRRRLALAAELYEGGTAATVVLSGDAHEDDDGTRYDEPESMRAWIVDLGVPAEALVLDKEGFDTTATCRRVHDLTGAASVVVVTQDYHLRRALFACAAAGLDAVGVGASAQSVKPAQAVWWRVREVPASFKAGTRELLGW